jgi:L-2-hydroxyglutarate oxidase LhgO
MNADVVVVGAGVVGLAAAAALSRSGRSVVVLERNPGVGREITSRNSEVIHAGIYYPAGSLKAKLCVAGREALYARCEQQKIPHRRCEKLIVAVNSDECGTLEQLQHKAAANGVELPIIDAAEIERCEPGIRAHAALLSKRTGIIDGQALCLSYLAEMESHDGLLSLHTEVIAIEPRSGGYQVIAVDSDGERSSIDCRSVVNAAGMTSDHIARCAGLDIDSLGYRIYPCKGDYFAIAPAAKLKLSRLVYPVPVPAGLGIHITMDLAGRYRLGPDTEYIDLVNDARDYHIDPAKAEAFARAVGRFLPGLRREWLTPDYAGIRPKLAAPGEPFRDFAIREESDRGLPGFVNLIGIESPGLTASPAIADFVVSLLDGDASSN